MIFFYGMTGVNAGPCNVNQSLIEVSDGKMLHSKLKNKYMRAFESLYKVLRSQVVIISPIWSSCGYVLKLAKLFNRKVIYLMHAYAAYENEINNGIHDVQALRLEKIIMKNCDMILAVSEQYSYWLKDQLPQYRDKIYYLNNGVDVAIREKRNKKKFSIAVAGGNRNIKNNDIVYEAVKQLNEKQNQKYVLHVFGRYYENNRLIPDCDWVIKEGQLEREEYYRKLDEIELFVINSEIESFGLVVADALNCNCSILVSENTGSRSILKTYDMDIIKDCHNVNELATKIEYVCKTSNAMRLAESIDVDKISKRSAYAKLLNICEKV